MAGEDSQARSSRGGWLAVFLPGLALAATGVGVGDLATPAFEGGRLGLAVLWAVPLGAVMKWTVTEGLARWQLATGTSYLDGMAQRLGRPALLVWALYLVVWTMLVAVTLMSAAGVAVHAIVPLPDPLEPWDVPIYGAVQSLLAWLVLRSTGFATFERIMAACVAVMVMIVIGSLTWTRPPGLEAGVGAVSPLDLPRDWATWRRIVAVIGGVGGTVTILGYGYWIAEQGRSGREALPTCRVDLAGGYTLTALFGMAMVVHGARVGPLEGGGTGLIIALADSITAPIAPSLRPFVRGVFLLGAWAAIASSLLGVWQSVPYLFANTYRLMRSGSEDAGSPPGSRARVYRMAQAGLAILPMPLLLVPFETLQRTYAILGALFIPWLAATLLMLNGRASWVGEGFRYGWGGRIALAVILLFFGGIAAMTISRAFG